ncbi:hypothetical protein WISP_143635 [Willisornis vidua]|uniref:Uncharacterized protein n=1 Tax=Willisornis vidua TaxID=1566151 RepID=A0ABQ9CRU6_9PASS|nr:hypothetical protein WISP_143635 [Willisornis vidua]
MLGKDKMLPEDQGALAIFQLFLLALSRINQNAVREKQHQSLPQLGEFQSHGKQPMEDHRSEEIHLQPLEELMSEQVNAQRSLSLCPLTMEQGPGRDLLTHAERSLPWSGFFWIIAVDQGIRIKRVFYSAII